MNDPQQICSSLQNGDNYIYSTKPQKKVENYIRALQRQQTRSIRNYPWSNIHSKQSKDILRSLMLCQPELKFKEEVVGSHVGRLAVEGVELSVSNSEV